MLTLTLMEALPASRCTKSDEVKVSPFRPVTLVGWKTIQRHPSNSGPRSTWAGIEPSTPTTMNKRANSVFVLGILMIVLWGPWEWDSGIFR